MSSVTVCDNTLSLVKQPLIIVALQGQNCTKPGASMINWELLHKYLKASNVLHLCISHDNTN